MTAFGYIRKSRMDEDSTTSSPAVQEARIRALAAGRDADIVIVSDLNVSGGKAMDHRPAFAEIVRSIEDGSCTAVYAYDLSRLFRNLKEQIAFFEMTQARGIPVRLAEGEVTEVSGATGELMLNVLGSMNQWMRKNTSEKIKASLAAKRANGERLGGRPYGHVRTTTLADGTTRTVGDGEDAAAVVDAYRETGSFFRAAKQLDAAKLPTRNGRSRGWSPSAVRAVVSRVEPDLIIERRAEDRPIRGSRTTARPARFGRVNRTGFRGESRALLDSVPPTLGLRQRLLGHSLAYSARGQRTGVDRFKEGSSHGSPPCSNHSHSCAGAARAGLTGSYSGAASAGRGGHPGRTGRARAAN